jgi:mRNA interferase MazF
MNYIPKQGDIIFMDFDPQAGHEQQGRRPALVISNEFFNKHTQMAMVCPITNTDNKFPLHVPLNTQTRTTGVILCEHVKCQDIQKRNATFVEKAPAEIVAEVKDIIIGFVE